MTARGRTTVVGAAGALLWLLLMPVDGLLAGPGGLGPVMAELDGVHPVRAVQARVTAYAPGVGFLDKYPPLGSFLMGLVVQQADPGFGDAVAERAEDVVAIGPAGRIELAWSLRDRIPPILRAQRRLSQAAMAIAVGLAAALAALLARRLPCRSLVADMVAPAVVLLAFGRSYPVAYYGATTNVDALALAAGVGALTAVCGRRVLLAAALAALATALKDPAFVLGPVVVAAAWAGAGARRAAASAGTGLAVYALLSGALTAPATWWAHMRYLVTGGVEGVARIDPTDALAWPGLLGYAVDLALGAVGAATLVLGVVGLVLLARRDRRSSWSLSGVVLATLLVFVVPAGFVYVRFLLLPLAVLGIGAGITVAALTEALLAWADRGPVVRKLWAAGIFALVVTAGSEAYGRLTARATWAGAPNEPADELMRMIGAGDDPRAEAAGVIRHLAEPGEQVVVFADAREHGPPLDPGLWRVDVRGINEAEASLAGWLAGPAAARPRWILLMNFPTELPSGAAELPGRPPVEGARIAGVYSVREVFGRPTRATVERTLTVRPTITLLELDPP